MYNQEAISALIHRIGWEKPLDPTSSIVLDIDNIASDSSRKVNSFHQLASVENMYAAVSVVDMEMEPFNAFLASTRSQAVVSVLNEALEKHPEHDFKKDYTSLLIDKAPIFDDAIGYTVAISALELFLSSNRKNFAERNAALSFQALKLELEGAKNDRGYTVAKGIIFKRWKAVQAVSSILFPEQTGMTGSTNWD